MWLVNVFNDLTQLSLCSNKMWAIISASSNPYSQLPCRSCVHKSRLNAFVNFVVWKMSKLFIPFLPFLSLPVTDFFLLLFSLKKSHLCFSLQRSFRGTLVGNTTGGRKQYAECFYWSLPGPGPVAWYWVWMCHQWARHHEWDLLGYCLYVLQQLLTKNVWLLFTCFVRLKPPSIHNSQGLLTRETSLSFLDRF